jgi:hypothetical protein
MATGIFFLTELFVDRLLVILLCDTFVLKAEPLGAVGADKSIVVAAVDASAVHKDAVELKLVPDAPICVGAQILPVADIQIQLFIELIPVVDLRAAADLLSEFKVRFKVLRFRV